MLVKNGKLNFGTQKKTVKPPPTPRPVILSDKPTKKNGTLPDINIAPKNDGTGENKMSFGIRPVNSPLIRPYFLGEVAWGGYLRFP